MPDTALDRLATALGIEPTYRDGFGAVREVPADTKRALLAAMGVAVEDEAAIAASLAAAEAPPVLLPPIVLQDEGEAPLVTLAIAEELRGRLASWTLAEEDGTRQSGRVALERLEERGRDGAGRPCLALPFPSRPGRGYHRLEVEVEPDGPKAATTLIRAPRRCLGADEVLGGRRAYGLSCQLYALRSERDQGIGDLEDLARLGEAVAQAGCDFIGVNPLHALFPADSAHYGPYSPSSRLFLNVAAIAPDAVPELACCEDAQRLLAEAREPLAELRAAELIDHPASFALKRAVLEALYAHFAAQHLKPDEPSERGKAFLRFVATMGAALERQAVFEALHERMLAEHGPERWAFWTWPEELRDPRHEAVAAFAREHGERVRFFQYLQWLADQQLEAAQARMRAAGMAIGLYRDLAVAVNPAGGAVFAEPTLLLRDVAVGAPPDAFNAAGQNWGLAPMSPKALVERGYRPFADAVRQNMRHAGALRIDHAMTLARLFLIPEGMSGAEGTYVRYPLDDLLRILALESHRQRCLVIGEDLGTVPEGFRERLAEAGVLSCRLLIFEREDDGSFKPPAAYPEAALLSVSTHDLPTLRGFWQGRDIDWRERLDPAADADAYARRRAERAEDRRLLLEALRAEGLLPEGVDPQAPPGGLTPELALALHRFLARAPGRLLAVQLEDTLLELDQVNLPGTTEEHPNWRRRLRLPVEGLGSDPGLRDLLAAVAAERPRD